MKCSHSRKQIFSIINFLTEQRIMQHCKSKYNFIGHRALLSLVKIIIIYHRAFLSATPDESLAEHRAFLIIYNVCQPNRGGGGRPLIFHEEPKPDLSKFAVASCWYQKPYPPPDTDACTSVYLDTAECRAVIGSTCSKQVRGGSLTENNIRVLPCKPHLSGPPWRS